MARWLSAFLVLAVGTWPALAQSGVDSMLKKIQLRNIGPANMSGRVTELAVFEPLPRIMYVASAASGVWKTTNAGTTWKPVFERETSAAIGAVAVAAKNPNLVWAGTGEANARNSVSWGDGVYKSEDGGRTWKNMGLRETHHIGRIVIDPRDENIVYVAALGKLWASNPDRGIFKTVDGGKTWQKVLFLNDDTGCIDLAQDLADPNILYASAYQVRRDAFSGGNPKVQTGPAAGLYKSSDSGKTWKRLTKGLPENAFGRCGFSIYRKNSNTVFAVVQTDKTAVPVAGQLANQKKLTPDFGGIFRSDDKGETWTYLNSLCPRPFYYGQIRVDPQDDQRVYVLGINFHMSTNGGKTFLDGNQAKGTHADYHALWINPRDSHHLVLGCDGGMNISYDRSETWERLRNLPISQFYAIGLDTQTPYRVYGGLQDNGTWGAPTRTKSANGVSVADWSRYLGFDGYYCQIDPDDPDTLYCEGQYGILRRVHVMTENTIDIKPRLNAKGVTTNIQPPLESTITGIRFNWSSPMLLSPYDPKTLYYGGNYLFRSTNRGDTWTAISPDLTLGKPGLNEYQGHSISTFTVSPKLKGLLYVGTDDGRLLRTDDEGKNWQDLSKTLPNIPLNRWITRVEASHHDADTVYVAIDRHRNDDRAPYLWKSTNRGQTWTSLVANLPPQGPIHAFREDARNKDLLYVGTENGLFFSTTSGRHWQKHPALPNVPVHDVVVHPRDRELVIATHGRGIYVMDVAPLQQWNVDLEKSAGHFFEITPAQAYRIRTRSSVGSKDYIGDNPAYGALMYLYLRETPATVPTVKIRDAKGMMVVELKGEAVAGVQRFQWRLNQPKTPAGVYRPVPSGNYTAEVTIAGITQRRPFTVQAEE